MSFTKGLPHRQSDGLVSDVDDPLRLRAAINAGFTLEFDLNVPLGAAWQFHGGTGTDRANLDALPADEQIRHGRRRPRGSSSRCRGRTPRR